MPFGPVPEFMDKDELVAWYTLLYSVVGVSPDLGRTLPLRPGSQRCKRSPNSWSGAGNADTGVKVEQALAG
jgi:hypothetical protein